MPRTTITVELHLDHDEPVDDVTLGASLDRVLENSTASEAILCGLEDSGVRNVTFCLIGSDHPESLGVRS